MRIVIAPDKFKGSLTSADASTAIEAGLRRALGDDITVDTCPLADGGEGTVQALVQALGGRVGWFDVCGPLPGTTVRAPIGFIEGGKTAVIELAGASGLHHLAPEQRDPTRTTTYGTGELMETAAAFGAKRILLGLGGSATCDGGLGIAQAWGAAIKLMTGKTFTSRDRKLTGGDAGRVTAITRHNPNGTALSYNGGNAFGGGNGGASVPEISDGSLLDRRGVEFVVACDVSNPLLGPDGAAHIFGPQKGATPSQVTELDAGLAKLVERLGLMPVALLPGAGAAGGVGFGMAAFLGAKIVSGAELVFEALRLNERLKGADLCITAEGRFDGQSLQGKAPFAVAKVCKDANVPCVVIAGSLGDDLDAAYENGVTAAVSIIDRPMALADATEQAAALLERAACNIACTFAAGRKTNANA